MLTLILRTTAICTLLVVIGAASFNFALSGGLDQLICALISLMAVLVLLASGAGLRVVNGTDPLRRWKHRSMRKGVTPNVADRG